MGEFEDYLSHHGILGQKWGVRNALWYPIEAYRRSKTYLESVANSDGGKKVRSGAKKAADAAVSGAKKAAETTVKVAKNANERRKERVITKRERKAEKANAKKQELVRRKEEDFENRKERILRSGTPAEILSIADHLTTQELQNAIDRNNRLSSLKEMESKRIKDYKDSQHRKKWGAAIAVLNAYGALGKSLRTIADATKNVRDFMDLFEETEKDKKARKKAKEKKLDSTSWEDILKNLDSYDSESLEYLAKRKKNRDAIVGKEKTLEEAIAELAQKK